MLSKDISSPEVCSQRLLPVPTSSNHMLCICVCAGSALYNTVMHVCRCWCGRACVAWVYKPEL